MCLPIKAKTERTIKTLFKSKLYILWYLKKAFTNINKFDNKKYGVNG